MHKRIGFCCQWFHHDQTLKKKQLEVMKLQQEINQLRSLSFEN